MSSTRYSQQPLQIYQDPTSSFDRAPMPSMQNSNSRKISPLRPIKNAASRRNIVFNPPQNGLSKHSPSKATQQTSSSPSRAPFGNKLNTVSMPPPGGPSYNTDSMQKKQPSMSRFKPQKALFTNFSNNAAMDQENYSQPFHPVPIAPYREGLHQNNFSLDEGLYGPKLPQKRLMEAAPIHESRNFKRTKVEEHRDSDDGLEFIELPAPESFAPLHDDGTKPSHSYAQLIGMAILRAKNRQLTLAQIYKWITDTYSFYGATDGGCGGWQNSIRHNLSLNKAFVKQERPKDDPGKGNYWVILPGMEHLFLKDKPTTKKSSNSNENLPVLSTNLTPVNLPEVAQFKPPPPPPATLSPPELPQSSQPSYSQPQTHMATITELSSDATIPGSDACNTDPEVEEEAQEEIPSSPLIQSSPPMAMMHSSPPVVGHIQKRHDTPPPVPRFPSSSRSRSHKRKFASMDDSGYFSSLDSSALRPQRMMGSEADRPRIKRGRAEEEIARLRGSSYDSPTQSLGRAMFAPPSSSPLRRSPAKNDISQMLPPLTPAVKLKAPVRPPPSVSPNTNLRMHRDRVRALVGSPLRGMTTLDENMPFSPAFTLDDSSFMFQDFSNVDFDIFTDSSAGHLTVPGNGSPEKRSAKRPRLDRARSTNILADISNHKSVSSTPLLKFTPSLNAPTFSSPFKGLGLMESPSKLLGISSPSKIASPNFGIGVFDLPQDDFFGSEFLAEDVNEGWDIMQGFQKIGSGAGNANAQASRPAPPKMGGTRPPLGRSFTSRF